MNKEERKSKMRETRIELRCPIRDRGMQQLSVSLVSNVICSHNDPTLILTIIVMFMFQTIGL